MTKSRATRSTNSMKRSKRRGSSRKSTFTAPEATVSARKSKVRQATTGWMNFITGWKPRDSPNRRQNEGLRGEKIASQAVIKRGDSTNTEYDQRDALHYRTSHQPPPG